MQMCSRESLKSQVKLVCYVMTIGYPFQSICWLYIAWHFESRFKGLVGSAYILKAACESLGYRRTPILAACRELLI